MSATHYLQLILQFALLLTTTAMDSNVWIKAAIAQTAVQNVGAQTAQGTYQTGVQPVTIGTGQGVTFSWIQTGEMIQRVWLDDPSQVVVDFDGCLSSPVLDGREGGGSGYGSTNCGGAQIMRVRQLQEPIDFPANVVASQGNRVNLTVITNASSGRKIYQFQLVLAGGMPPVSLINIIPAPAIAPAQLTLVTREYQQQVLSQLSRGLANAEAQGLVDTTSTAYNQLKDCIARMQQGITFADAMQQSNVPRSLVDRIRSYASH